MYCLKKKKKSFIAWSECNTLAECCIGTSYRASLIANTVLGQNIVFGIGYNTSLFRMQHSGRVLSSERATIYSIQFYLFYFIFILSPLIVQYKRACRECLRGKLYFCLLSLTITIYTLLNLCNIMYIYLRKDVNNN